MLRTLIIFTFSVNLICASSVLAASSSNAAMDEHIISLVRSQNFDKLETMLVQIENDYEKDYQKEKEVDLAFQTFYIASADLDRLLGNWIKAKPNSYVAYMARGVYYSKVGWAKRGGKYFDKTTKAQINGMEFFFKKAFKDFEHARTINKKMLHPLCYEMDILMNFGSKDQIRKLHDEALQINPMSLTARLFYITTILPRWGGSISEIEKEVESTRPLYTQNPALKILDGRVAAELGDQAFFNEDYTKAVQLFTEAITSGDYWYYYKQRGEAYSYSGQLERSNSDLRVALKLHPNNDRILYMLGMNLYKGKQYKETIPLLSKVLEINPYDHKTLDIRGDCYMRLGKLDLALSDFEKAIALNPENREYLGDRERVRQMMGLTN